MGKKIGTKNTVITYTVTEYTIIGLTVYLIHLSSVDQAGAGVFPLILVGPAVGETAILDPIQCVGSSVRSDCVLGGSVLLPSAASDRNCYTDGHFLHQKGKLLSLPASTCC